MVPSSPLPRLTSASTPTATLLSATPPPLFSQTAQRCRFEPTGSCSCAAALISSARKRLALLLHTYALLPAGRHRELAGRRQDRGCRRQRVSVLAAGRDRHVRLVPAPCACARSAPSALSLTSLAVLRRLFQARAWVRTFSTLRRLRHIRPALHQLPGSRQASQVPFVILSLQ